VSSGIATTISSESSSSGGARRGSSCNAKGSRMRMAIALAGMLRIQFLRGDARMQAHRRDIPLACELDFTRSRQFMIIHRSWHRFDTIIVFNKRSSGR
jgi:hypothetical protein